MLHMAANPFGVDPVEPITLAAAIESDGSNDGCRVHVQLTLNLRCQHILNLHSTHLRNVPHKDSIDTMEVAFRLLMDKIESAQLLLRVMKLVLECTDPYGGIGGCTFDWTRWQQFLGDGRSNSGGKMIFNLMSHAMDEFKPSTRGNLAPMWFESRGKLHAHVLKQLEDAGLLDTANAKQNADPIWWAYHEIADQFVKIHELASDINRTMFIRRQIFRMDEYKLPGIDSLTHTVKVADERLREYAEAGSRACS